MVATRIAHLVVGADLLGLALADQLLRRGVSPVWVIDEGGAPSRRGLGNPAIVLRSGRPALRALESTGLLLLEEWRSYLELDPGFRRCGSLHLHERPGMERLTPAQAQARQPFVSGAPDAHVEIGFDGESGVVQSTDLLAALHWQVRRRGGRLLFDTELTQLTPDAQADGWRFEAGARAALATRVTFTGQHGDARYFSRLGQNLGRFPQRRTWSRFELDLVGHGGCLIQAPFTLDAAELEDAGDILEELPAPDPRSELGCVVDCGAQGVTIELPGRSLKYGAAAAEMVDWQALGAFRAATQGCLPDLARAGVRRASAEARWALDEGSGLPVLEDATRSLCWAGAHGDHPVLQALGLAHTLAAAATAQSAVAEHDPAPGN